MTFLLLFMFTGSVVQPVRALLGTALTLGATLGTMVWIFQDGHLAPRTQRRMIRRPEPAGQGTAPSERWTYLAAAGSPLVLLVLADAVFWLIDVRRDHSLGISG